MCLLAFSLSPGMSDSCSKVARYPMCVFPWLMENTEITSVQSDLSVLNQPTLLFVLPLRLWGCPLEVLLVTFFFSRYYSSQLHLASGSENTYYKSKWKHYSCVENAGLWFESNHSLAYLGRVIRVQIWSRFWWRWTWSWLLHASWKPVGCITWAFRELAEHTGDLTWITLWIIFFLFWD